MNFNFNIQTHLIIGQNNSLDEYTTSLLQNVYCKKSACNECFVCNQIKSKNHENILYLIPEKQYNLDQIDLVIKTISYSLENTNEKYFIIFSHADLLTIACSNRLLKSIEEPSKNYYFVFLTHRPKSILPTIYSRCVVTNLNSNLNENDNLVIIESSLIAKFFIQKNSDSIEFLKTIDKSTINEFETIELIENLINYWSKKCKTSIINNDQKEISRIQQILEILNASYIDSPMPGSAKIFWKNLFLNLSNLLN